MDTENVVYIRTHNRILVLKKKELLPFVTTQMNLEDVMLNEISREKNSGCQGLGVGQRVLSFNLLLLR